MDQVFAAVTKSSPSLIFVDEIDLLGAPYVSRLMSFMDGLAHDSGMVVIAATNVKLESLCSSLFRVGRFEHNINFKIPDGQDRLAILQSHTRNLKLASDVHIETLASFRTIGMSGAELALICSQAAVRYIRESALGKMRNDELTGVSMRHFEEAAAAMRETD